MSEGGRFIGDFNHVTEHLEHMWEHLVSGAGGAPGTPRFAPPVIEPPTDVYLTEHEIVVLMEIAGMREEEVEIQLEGRRMIVRGTKRDRRSHGEGHLYHAVEIQYGPFERLITLPAEVDHDRVKIAYDDGLLQITLPKLAREPKRKVRITVR